MKRYFLTQCKRLLRPLPGVLLAMVFLLGCLSLVFSFASKKTLLSEENQKIQLAMVGTSDDPILSMGLMALEAYDTSRLSMDIAPMEEQEAMDALAAGKIAAYVVIPEGFVTQAYKGDILPLKFVSTAGASGLVSIFKTEFTGVITHMLITAQKGTYAMADIAKDNGIRLKGNMDEMALKYAEYVFHRDQLYRVEDLGIKDELGMLASMMCGFCVVFLCLFCLPFAPQMIRKDHQLSRMLAAGGRPAFLQALADFAAYGLCLLALVTVILTGAAVCVPKAVEPVGFFPLLWRMGAVTFFFASMSYLIYTLATDLIGGVLVQFFLSTALCFVGGCLYPVYFFPVSVQEAAAWLPSAMGRTLLSTGITQADPTRPLLILLLGSLVCFLLGALVHCHRTKEVGQ